MGGACRTYGGEERFIQSFGGKLEGKRPLGSPRHRWEDNIKMDLQEVGCGRYGLDRAGSEYGKVAGNCEGFNESSDFIRCGEFLENRLAS